MPVQANATFTFDHYAVEDGGVRLWFVCLLPGPGQPTDYDVLLLDADLAAVTTQAQLRTLVTAKLQRTIRASGIAAKLDQFIGQSVTL